MNIKNLFSACLLAVFSMFSMNLWASNIDATAARAAASQFIKQHATRASGSFRASAANAELNLAFAKASTAVEGANAYYAFNINGGGFIIIAGEDRATQVLGYSDKGLLNANNLPCNLKALLDSYQREIEYLQSYEGDDLIPIALSSQKVTVGVDPLIKTNWGQEMPYYLQCPLYQGEYCVVGCVATAMAQVMKYWRYPESSAAISGFYSYGYGNVSALPATTFNYSLMLKSYCHWDWDNSELIQDTYTQAQAQEVAKLSRYCGQAVEMQYSPEGSGAYSSDQLSAMKKFGYRSTAKLVQKSGWWGSNYTTAQWEALMKTELNAGRPILYSADDPSAGGHAFICDGYNDEGKFHYNFGWYGTCDGWYVSTALNMTHRDGDYLSFSSGHEMLTGVEPPEGWVNLLIGDVNKDGNVAIDDITALIDYVLTQDATGIDLEAADMDENGSVDIADATALIDYLLNNN